MMKNTNQTPVFGGHEFTVTPTSNDLILQCKGIEIPFSQLIKFKVDKNMTLHQCGRVTMAGRPDGNEISIGCLTDTKANFNRLYHQYYQQYQALQSHQAV